MIGGRGEIMNKNIFSRHADSLGEAKNTSHLTVDSPPFVFERDHPT
jgi:hypothetical protein